MENHTRQQGTFERFGIEVLCGMKIPLSCWYPFHRERTYVCNGDVKQLRTMRQQTQPLPVTKQPPSRWRRAPRSDVWTYGRMDVWTITSTHTCGPGRGVPPPARGCVGVRTKNPQCACRVPRPETDGTGNGTREGPGQHAQNHHSAPKPPGTTPSRGPERVRHRASPAPPPRRWPAAGTMSLVLGRPPCAPRSRQINPGAQTLVG